MAKTNVVDLVVYGVGAYLVYTAGKRGYLGQTVQGALLHVQPGSGGAPSTPPGGGGGNGGCAFIPGQRYVARAADGKWVVVIDGVERVRVDTQSCAEQAYNWRVCNGPWPACLDNPF